MLHQDQAIPNSFIIHGSNSHHFPCWAQNDIAAYRGILLPLILQQEINNEMPIKEQRAAHCGHPNSIPQVWLLWFLCCFPSCRDAGKTAASLGQTAASLGVLDEEQVTELESESPNPSHCAVPTMLLVKEIWSLPASLPWNKDGIAASYPKHLFATSAPEEFS